MPGSTYRFDTLDTLVDDIHVLFDQWEADGCLEQDSVATGIHRLKLAVHEWTANLIQHAEFGGRAPAIELCIWRDDQCLCCSIEDNSNGFDLQQWVAEDKLKELARTMPERGMGLLMMQECAEKVMYSQLENGRYRIQLCVPVDEASEIAPTLSSSHWRRVLRMSGNGLADEK